MVLGFPLYRRVRIGFPCHGDIASGAVNVEGGVGGVDIGLSQRSPMPQVRALSMPQPMKDRLRQNSRHLWPAISSLLMFTASRMPRLGFSAIR